LNQNVVVSEQKSIFAFSGRSRSLSQQLFSFTLRAADLPALLFGNAFPVPDFEGRPFISAGGGMNLSVAFGTAPALFPQDSPGRLRPFFLKGRFP
jgi:hypothetical protein